MSKLVSLEQWAKATYGDSSPCIDTLRRWCREGRIHPQPEKHGKAYYLDPEARYIDASNSDLLRRIRHGSKAA